MKLLLITLASILTFTASSAEKTQIYNSIINNKSESALQDLHVLVKNSHHRVLSYREARRHLFGSIHLQEDSNGHFIAEVYCGKKVRDAGVGPGQIPNHRIVNAEHTWPKYKFNRSFPYNTQVSDMHNLYPSDSVANSKRGHLIFAEVSGDYATHDCSSSFVGHINGTHLEAFEPPMEHKGNVARALFYFSVRYKIHISAEEESFLRQWHLLDPVDGKEKKRNAEIERLQGNSNPFIDRPELVDQIRNF